MDIGLIGCGRWGRNILRDLVALGARVHVVRLNEGPSEQPLAGAASLSTDIATLPPVDGYVVATPTSTHADVIDRLLPGGRPIFVEKPLSASLDHARRIAAAAPDRLFVMDKWRHHSGIESLRSHLADGLIGTPLHIRLMAWSVGQNHDDVGPQWILAPHDLSIIIHLLGALPPLYYAYPHIAGRPELGFIAGLGGNGGISALLDIGTLSAAHFRRLTITGTAGLLEMHGGYADRIVWSKAAPGTPRPEIVELPFAPNMPLYAELEKFLIFLRGDGPPPHSSAQDGLATVERLTEITARIGG